MKFAAHALFLAASSLAAPYVAAAAPAPVATPAGAVSAAIDSVAQDAIQKHLAAGLVIGVAQRGKPLLIKPYGLADIENNVPMRADSVLRIGSVTKQFTAAIVLLLAEDGKLSVDDRLSKFFPDFPRADEVTLRQLLTHTSGVSNFTRTMFTKGEGRPDRTTKEMIDYIAGLKPPYDFDPGTGWNYSNSGYMLLGAIIEQVTGKPFGTVLKERITDPLGLKDTKIDDLSEIVPHRAHGYARITKDTPGFANADFLSMSVAAAAGAMRSTAQDMLAWNAALFGGKLLKPDSLKAMTTPAHLKDGRLTSLGRTSQDGPPPSEYGFGLMMSRAGEPSTIGHGGSIPGFNSMLENLPDDGVSYVVLSNTDGATYALSPALKAAILKARK